MRLKPPSRAVSTTLAAVCATTLLTAGVTAAHALSTPTASAGAVAAQPAPGSATAARPAARDQVAEPGTRTSTVSATSALASGSQRVCGDSGSRWLRVRIADLRLDGTDSIKLTSDAGDALALTARNWTGKGFYTRALKGSCVTVTEDLSSAASRYSIDQVQSSTTSLEAATVTVAAAGDICGSACAQTRALLDTMNPDAVLTAGDNAYESGTLSEYNTTYDPEWGQYKNITYPTAGNHEYKTSGASGYFSYFGSRAGESGKGYYSYDVGDWHIVALNSNISRTATSTQVQWLKDDLAATTKPCIAAHWHHSRFAAGNYSDDSTVKPFWDALYAAKADLVITGHDHNYLRFAKSKPDGTAAADGIRQLLIGTGGRALYGSGGSTSATIEKSNYNTFGVGKLTLTSSGYTADFVPVAGRTFTDTVTSSCNAKGSTPVPNFALSAAPSSVSVNPGASGTSTVTVSSTGGFSSATSLTASGLPAGVTSTFSPASVTPAANGSATSTLTFTASSTAAAGTTAVTITGTSGTTSRTTTVNLTVNPTSSASGLTNGVAKTNLSGAQGSSTYFTLSVPTGATSLKFVTTGGTGDADLYVKAGTQPSTTAYDCKSDGSSSAETCTMSSITPGTYHVLLRGYSAYSGVSLTGTYTTTTDTTPTLTSGVPVTGLSGASGSQVFYRLDVPSGSSSVTIEISGGTGDADLYVKAGSKPSTSSYDCRPYKDGNTETCTDTTVTAGPYYVLLNGYSAYSGVTLKGTYAP